MQWYIVVKHGHGYVSASIDHRIDHIGQQTPKSDASPKPAALYAVFCYAGNGFKSTPRSRELRDPTKS